jgi:hypothetical protein
MPAAVGMKRVITDAKEHFVKGHGFKSFQGCEDGNRQKISLAGQARKEANPAGHLQDRPMV